MKTTSYELSLQLKKAGIAQDAYLSWYVNAGETIGSCELI